ncbi:MAG: hypothetical protein FJX77_17155, partial [Armatimonadetes bacterium]|nr:hypothetical protein [Armatimonadota bacterium]
MSAAVEREPEVAPSEEWWHTADYDTALERLRKLVEATAIEKAWPSAVHLLQRWPEDSVVRYWHRVLEPATARTTPGRSRPTWDADRKWLEAHHHEYPGCWLAVYAGECVAAHPDLPTVQAMARSALGNTSAILWYEPKRERVNLTQTHPGAMEGVSGAHAHRPGSERTGVLLRSPLTTRQGAPAGTLVLRQC